MKTYTAQYNGASEMTIEGIRFLRPGFLDSFLGYLDEKSIEGKSVFIKSLMELLGKVDDENIDIAVVDKYLEDCPKLSEYMPLARAVIIKRLNLAGIKKCPAATDKITFLSTNYLRGVFIVNYFIAKALTSIMSKNDAIKLFNEFTDLQTRTKYQLPHLENVSDLLTAKSPASGVFAGGHDFIEFELDAGQVGCKVAKCKWHEVLKEFNDPDFEYAIICHYDFEAARVHNSNFLLTREGTLAQGRPYCDFIWHDIRIDSNPSHPTQEFWDKIATP